MTQIPELIDVAKPVTEDELDSALLGMTGDLDKVRVLRSTLPRWMVQAKSTTLTALEQLHGETEGAHRRLEERLSRLVPLDRFCLERLQAHLIAQGHPGLDVHRDRLELPVLTELSVAPYLTGVSIHKNHWEQLTLIQAAMQNFPASAAESKMPPALIRSAATGEAAAGITVAQFIGYCQELDLGGAYQAHLGQVFNLSPSGEGLVTFSYNQAALDIGHAKCLDLQIDVHIAHAKGHLSEATFDRLLKLVKADRRAGDVDYLAPDGKRLIWQGVNIDEACVWGVMVLSDDTPGHFAGERVVVYMPNEPQRPLFEYASLDDFKTYLTLQLQAPSFRRFFQGCLDESERVGFFQRFDKRRTLGAVEALAVSASFSEFFFNACVGKVQLDARVLAVPVAEVDEQARRERLLGYLETGLDLLNLAAFVVPGLGQLMLGVAIGQLLGEVFDGVEDWNHHDRAEALKHLVNVAENIAAMALFAAGGRVVGTLRREAGGVSDFFDKTEAVTLADQRPRLWRPRLAPYRQPDDVALQWVANPQGVYQANGRSYIKLDGSLFGMSYDTHLGRWCIDHPKRPQAYRPPLAHNNQGGWQHIHERPTEWQYPLYNLQRIDPSLKVLPPEAVGNISAISELDVADLQYLAQEHEPLPERFHDCVLHYEQHRKVTELAHHLEHQTPPGPFNAHTQLLALPMMPTWPEGRFFELLDSQGNLLESHPDLAPFDYEDLSIHITEQQLKQNQVMSTLLTVLNDEERTQLLGTPATGQAAQDLLARRLLDTVKSNHRELCRRLYRNRSYRVEGELLPLTRRYPQLPGNVAWELMSKATRAQRRTLRTSGRVPLRLAQRTRESIEQLQQDQALMGLYWPQLADTPTRQIAVGMLGQLGAWPKDLFLQLREGRVDGEVLAQTGPPAAQSRRTVVKIAERYQAFDADGAPLNPVADGPEGFYQALLDCLSPPQRQAMHLHGDYAASRLRSQLRFKTQDDRSAVARSLWPERPSVEAFAEHCVKAQAPEPSEMPVVLLRKLKKLYPGLSQAQIADLLQAAGTDPLSRAKAVEQLELQYRDLQRALKFWRLDTSWHDPQTEPRWDYQLSRHQVVKAIERSWRKLFILRDADGAPVQGLALDGMLLGRLPTLPAQVKFDHVRKLSLKNMALNDDVAYFLKAFTGLHSLELSNNRITRLPEVLSHMPQLQHLYLDANQLQLSDYTHKKLAGLSQLKTLNLNDNPLLDAPDVSAMFELREVLLRNCRLRDFPGTVRRLPYLKHIDVRQNDISQLPDWLFQMPRTFTEAVNVRHNPLEARTQWALGQYRRRMGVGMGYLEDDIARLNEQKARDLWLPDERSAGFAEKHFAWTGLKEEPGSDGLFRLLAELGNTADATFVREDLNRR
ncbi:leucine-rich repeat domain-containing protein, partial [Pseudomonas cedrina subsp. fulgida]|nr:leucine-rich repeat domain-containing protein [Pseudomonas cedrina subsp. fulgida]